MTAKAPYGLFRKNWGSPGLCCVCGVREITYKKAKQCEYCYNRERKRKQMRVR